MRALREAHYTLRGDDVLLDDRAGRHTVVECLPAVLRWRDIGRYPDKVYPVASGPVFPGLPDEVDLHGRGH